MKVTASLFLLAVVYGYGQELPSITSPTNGQVFYVGETIKIRWHSNDPEAFTNVALFVYDDTTHGLDWINFDTDNDGSYDWVAAKQYDDYNWYDIGVIDSNAYDLATVQIEIRAGKRPVPVPITIRRVVSVEWQSVSNHTYSVESSGDLKNWSESDRFISTGTNSLSLYYAEGQPAFFRVFDLTPE